LSACLLHAGSHLENSKLSGMGCTQADNITKTAADTWWPLLPATAENTALLGVVLLVVQYYSVTWYRHWQ
jgi:hypothetical protein